MRDKRVVACGRARSSYAERNRASEFMTNEPLGNRREGSWQTEYPCSEHCSGRPAHATPSLTCRSRCARLRTHSQ